MRGAAALLLALACGPAAAQGLSEARFSEPTTRYDHGILGDAVEWGALELRDTAGVLRRIRLPQTRVFEDTAPRLADLDGDGGPEALVVETDLALGARLSVYGREGLIAATPFIGQTHRWLAPLASADLDGDGRVEIAYVDRPHLAKLLRVWRLQDGAMVEVAQLPGLTNHRIGESEIGGGVRDCGAGPELVLADADWRRVMAVRLDGGALTARPIGAFDGSFDAALACR